MEVRICLNNDIAPGHYKVCVSTRQNREKETIDLITVFSGEFGELGDSFIAMGILGRLHKEEKIAPLLLRRDIDIYIIINRASAAEFKGVETPLDTGEL